MDGTVELFRTPRVRVSLYHAASQRRALAADPAVQRFSFWPDARETTFAISIAAMQGRWLGDRKGWFNFAITGRDGDYIGDHAVCIEGDAAKIGIALLPDMRGRGLALEVIAGSIAWLRGLAVVRFQAEIDPANAASLTTFERAGFTRVRLDRDENGLFWLVERI
jgi:RimJ/RimL family protein N-acetyltransferase